MKKESTPVAKEGAPPPVADDPAVSPTETVGETKEPAPAPASEPAPYWYHGL